jgi:hypothetical protein
MKTIVTTVCAILFCTGGTAATEIVSSASQCSGGTVATFVSSLTGSGYVNSPGECPANLTPIHVPIYGMADSCPIDPGIAAVDPNGMVCSSGYVLTDAGKCSRLCMLGITALRTGGGLSVPLYATKNTTPAINIGYNGSVCYASLAAGGATNALNFTWDGNTYHSIR